MAEVRIHLIRESLVIRITMRMDIALEDYPDYLSENQTIYMNF